MKKHNQRLVPLALLVAGLSTLNFTGCSKSDRADTTTQIKDSYKDTKAAVVDAWGDITHLSFAKEAIHRNF